MGSHQENWFFRQISESKERGATWRVIGNQMLFSRTDMRGEDPEREIPFDVDGWDGYVFSRNRTYQHMYDNEIGNKIMLSGDTLQNWVSDLVWLREVEYDTVTGSGAIGVEFSATGTTSDGMEGSLAATEETSQNWCVIMHSSSGRRATTVDTLSCTSRKTWSRHNTGAVQRLRHTIRLKYRLPISRLLAERTDSIARLVAVWLRRER